jgi:hypothetical protein
MLEKLNPFSIAGDAYGAYTARQSAKERAAVDRDILADQQKARAEKQQAIDAGVVGPHLSTGRPGGVGTPVITAPHKGTPFDTATQLGGEESEKFQRTTGTFGDIGSELANKFKSGYPSAVLDPLTLPQAEGMVTETQNRFKNQLADAYKPLATQSIRTAGDISGVGDTGMTGPGNQVASFLQNMKKHLPYDPMEARRMVTTDVDRYGRQTGQVGGQALSTSGGGYMPPPITGPSFTSGISPMMQMSSPPLRQQDMTNYATGSGISNIFQNIAAEQDRAREQDNYNKLLKVFASRLGDQPAGAISPS